MWQIPIFDRTQADVDLVRLDPTNSNNKGAFNYNDLNRIESDCGFLMNFFNASDLFNKKINLIIKTDWNIRDIPTITDINRIRNNILTLKNNMNLNVEDIEFSDSLNYIKVNVLEKHLKLIKDVLDSFGKQFYRCNTFYCGSSGLSSTYFRKKIKHCGNFYCGKGMVL